MVATHAIKAPESTVAAQGSHGWSNLIYAGLGQHQWKPIVRLIGDLLKAREEVKQGSAISINEGEGDPYMFGGNSFMSVSEKAKALGWKQKQPNLEEAIRQALGPA